MYICAIAKHGWIDRDSQYEALVNDKTLQLKKSECDGATAHI